MGGGKKNGQSAGLAVARRTNKRVEAAIELPYRTSFASAVVIVSLNCYQSRYQAAPLTPLFLTRERLITSKAPLRD